MEFHEKLQELRKSKDLTQEEYNNLPANHRPLGGLSVPGNVHAQKNEAHFWSSKYAVCSPIMYDTAAISTTTGENSSTTYHFRVPFLSLVGGSTVKKLMLLPPNASKYQTDDCANFVVKEGIKVPEAGANFTIIIDWKLEFTNSSAN